MDNNFNNAQNLIIDSIKESLIKFGLGKFEIFLFGSEASKNHSDDSDIELFIISDDKLLFEEKLQLKKDVYQSLHDKKKFTIPLDLIIKSKEEFEYEKRFLGMLSYTVF